MSDFLNEAAANPGRSGHRMSIEAARVMYETREKLADLFGASDPLHVIFGLNVTDGINLALHGLLHPGDHVVTSSMEHNSIMRPLNSLENEGVKFTRVACQQDGTLDPILVEKAIHPETRMIVINHASNVCGTFLPIREIGKIARSRNLLFLVDAAQTAGVVPIDMNENNIDLFAFTGHKSLYGPMGTGGLIISERVDPAELSPIKQGGTGSHSVLEQQPEFFPDRYECGTPNAVGLAGLLTALKWLESKGINEIRAHEIELCSRLISGLQEIPGVTLYGTQDSSKQTATVAFNLNGMEPSSVGLRLDEEFNILCRVGLHCSPSAHQTLGTFPQGCVRFSLGAFNTCEDVDLAIIALEALAREVK